MITATLERPKKVKVETSSSTKALNIGAGGNSKVTPINKAKPWIMAKPKALAQTRVMPGRRKGWRGFLGMLGVFVLRMMHKKTKQKKERERERESWERSDSYSIQTVWHLSLNQVPKRSMIPSLHNTFKSLLQAGSCETTPASAKANKMLSQARSVPFQPLANHHWM